MEDKPFKGVSAPVSSYARPPRRPTLRNDAAHNGPAGVTEGPLARRGRPMATDPIPGEAAVRERRVTRSGLGMAYTGDHDDRSARAITIDLDRPIPVIAIRRGIRVHATQSA